MAQPDRIYVARPLSIRNAINAFFSTAIFPDRLPRIGHQISRDVVETKFGAEHVHRFPGRRSLEGLPPGKRRVIVSTEPRHPAIR